MADRHPVADFHQIGQVGGNVQQAAAAAPGQLGQQADVHLLDDPGCGGLQVVQKDLRHCLPRQVQRFGPAGDVPHHPLPQQRQRPAIPAIDLPQGAQNHVLGGDGGTEIVQKQHRCRTHSQIPPPGQSLGEGEQVIALAVRQHLHRQGGGRFQQLEGRLVLQSLRTAIIAEKFLKEQVPAVRGALVQQGVDHHFQRKADPPAVLGHQLPVRTDELGQIQPPLVQIGGLPGVGNMSGGDLLGVAGVKPGDDLSHESRSLPADVSLPVHQKLIQEGQCLDLLRAAEIDGVGFKHAQTGPQPPPVSFSPGLLQQAGEGPLAGEAAHKGQIVLHAQHPQRLHRLKRVHEGRVRLGKSGPGLSGEGGVHAQTLHAALKVPELGVNKGVAGALFVGDVVQLAQDHIESLRQGGNLRNLPAAGTLLLFHSEVGVNQCQTFR